MIVKTLKRAAAVAAILSTATVANANVLGMKKFHVGADVMGTTLDWNTTGGKNIFPKNPMNFGVFVGGEFYNVTNEFGLGLELGVEYMQKTNKNAAVTGGNSGNATAPVNAGYTFNYNSKLKAITPYLGITGSYSINEQFKLISMIGAGLAVTTVNQSLAGVTENGAPVVTSMNIPKLKKNAFVPMVRVGAQYNFNENIGVRANVGYRYMKALKARVFSTDADEYFSMQAKNSMLTYGAGVVFSF